MTIKKNIFAYGLFKKAAALFAAVIIFANFSFINKENLKFFAGGISQTPTVSQNVFNVSSYINKAAQAVSGLFNIKHYGIITSSAGVPIKQSTQNNDLLKSVSILLTSANTGSFSLNAAGVLCHEGFNIYNIYIDPGGGPLSVNFSGFLPYFLIMLLFFASSRKVFSSIFVFKTERRRLIV